jgi:hypothetical protein
VGLAVRHAVVHRDADRLLLHVPETPPWRGTGNPWAPRPGAGVPRPRHGRPGEREGVLPADGARPWSCSWARSTRGRLALR